MKDNDIDIRVIEDIDDLIKVFIVRGIVFMEEQNVSYRIERDEYEMSSTHIIAEIGEEPIGTGRIRRLDKFAKLERIAVRKEYRGNGYGDDILQFMLKVANEKGYEKYKLNAQAYLVDFYKKHGFKVKGDKFKEAGIEHYKMVKT